MSALLDKINIRDIVIGHIGTLTNDATGKKMPGDFLLFYIGPAVALAPVLYFQVRLSDTAISILTNALSLLAGLLFNLLVLMHSFGPSQRELLVGTTKRFFEQVHFNVAYSILISILALLPLVVAGNYRVEQDGRLISGYVAIYLAVHFALTMGMVLKRMQIMLFKRLP